MALFALPRIINYEMHRTRIMLTYIPKFSRIQSACITSKEFRDPNIKKPAPWPYETKKYRYWNMFTDGTLKRFDENTALIVVDGNIGAGKSSFAKQLAEAFDMKLFAEPDIESYFVSAYGYDIRKIDELLPPSYKCCDLSTFYKNPHHPNVTAFQFRMFMQRLDQYIDALAHILNTGQGVVMERCVYGDIVFLETMYKFGYISGPARQLYLDIRKNAVLEELFRPHLIIYLDISPEVTLERIKKRNDPAEVNSKVLTKEYLESIEYHYKQIYLKDMDKHAEILVYDWTNFGDVEVVVEDIERIDFDRYTKFDAKLEDWRKEDDWEWCYWRRRFTMHKLTLLKYANIFRPKVTELYHPGEEVEEFQNLITRIPG
ncbi:NADH dehydrogenase [ubiquinone] 1 alpha subcomplex subunit 10, mitochondrial, partial [Stegodyphus mimosarum]